MNGKRKQYSNKFKARVALEGKVFYLLKMQGNRLMNISCITIINDYIVQLVM